MDIVCFFETLTSICKTTQHQNPEEHQNKGYMVVSENKINIKNLQQPVLVPFCEPDKYLLIRYLIYISIISISLPFQISPLKNLECVLSSIQGSPGGQVWSRVS
jgi:hypothetical protein